MTRIENTEWSRMRNSMKTAFANLWKTSRTVLFSVVHDTDTHITHDRLRVGISWVGSMHRLIDYISLLVEKEVPLYMLWKSFDLFLWISECDKNLFWYFNPYKEFFPTVILIFPGREPLPSFITCLIFWTELLRDCPHSMEKVFAWLAYLPGRVCVAILVFSPCDRDREEL